MDIDQVYKFWWAADTEFAELDNSEPRSPNMLYDMLARLVPEGACVLDVGCGEGHHVQKLAAKYKAFGIDPLCNSGQNRSLQRGSVESIPFNDSTFDLIWCRAILMHVKEIGQAFRECFRVLRPGGVMILLTMFETDLMGRVEAERLYTRLGIHAKAMDRQFVENEFSCSGFAIESAEDVGSEFVEFYETDKGRASKDLGRLLRIRNRNTPALNWPRDKQEIALGMFEWTIYQALGKITSRSGSYIDKIIKQFKLR